MSRSEALLDIPAFRRTAATVAGALILACGVVEFGVLGPKAKAYSRACEERNVPQFQCDQLPSLEPLRETSNRYGDYSILLPIGIGLIMAVGATLGFSKENDPELDRSERRIDIGIEQPVIVPSQAAISYPVSIDILQSEPNEAYRAFGR